MFGVLGVKRSIGFDDQPVAKADEVGDIAANPSLAPKLEAPDLPAAQQ